MSDKLFKTLTSERLVFERLCPDHFNEFAAMDMDDEVMKFYHSPHGTLEQARENFERYLTYMDQFPEVGVFAAFCKDKNQFIGLGVLIHLELNPNHQAYEVGYRLPKKSWGKGYATEICKALIRYGFSELKLQEIFGTTHPDHLVSKKVLQKCGLNRIGTSKSYGGSALFRISAS